MEIQAMTAFEIKKGIEEGKFTSEEIVKMLFERIKEVDPKVEAYITICEEEAIKSAKMVDEKVKKGEKLGKFAGVPIAIKDNICTDGVKTTCASKILEDFIPPYDATVIRRLKEEDAVIIGKVNMDEFAMGSSTENSAFMKTKNPWDLQRVPGGSSGGSIRQPAAFCGVVGLKPTYGVVSRFGLVAFASSLDQIGPLGKTVEDCAMLLEVIAGEDKMDSTCAKEKYDTDYLSALDGSVKGLKIGVPKEFFGKGLNEEIKASMESVIEKLREMGAIVEEISMPITEEGLSSYYIISSAEASSNLDRYDGIRYGFRAEGYESVDDLMAKTRTEGFGKEVKRRIMLGTYALSSGYYDAYYNRAQKLRREIKREFAETFEKYDLILSPASPVLPFLSGEKSENPMEMYLADIYTVNINLAGVPAISLPCGFSKDGLPIGIQVIGPHFGEKKILKAAYALEQELKVDTLAIK